MRGPKKAENDSNFKRGVLFSLSYSEKFPDLRLADLHNAHLRNKICETQESADLRFCGRKINTCTPTFASG
jgi:hypothetical protein